MKSVNVVSAVYRRSESSGIGGGMGSPAVLGCISTSIVSELFWCEWVPRERGGEGSLGKSIL